MVSTNNKTKKERELIKMNYYELNEKEILELIWLKALEINRSMSTIFIKNKITEIQKLLDISKEKEIGS